MERLQWGFPIATALSLTCPKENDPSNAVDGLEGKKRIKKNTRHGISRNQISRSKDWKVSERSERALFPEGRGLGVGRKKKKVKKKVKERM